MDADGSIAVRATEGFPAFEKVIKPMLFMLLQVCIFLFCYKQSTNVAVVSSSVVSSRACKFCYSAPVCPALFSLFTVERPRQHVARALSATPV